MVQLQSRQSCLRFHLLQVAARAASSALMLLLLLVFVFTAHNGHMHVSSNSSLPHSPSGLVLPRSVQVLKRVI